MQGDMESELMSRAGNRRRAETIAGLMLGAVAMLMAGCAGKQTVENRVVEPLRLFDKWSTTGESRRLIDSPGVLGIPPDVPPPSRGLYAQDPLVLDTDDRRLFYTTSYQSPADLKKILTEQVADLNVSLNDAANQLIIRDPSWSKVEEIGRVLSRVDRAPPQVRIDALIAEVFADMTEDYEIKGDFNIRGEDFLVRTPYTLPGANIRWPDRTKYGFGLDLKDLRVGNSDFRLILNFLRSEGLARDLYRPSLVVANRQTATVEDKESIPIVQEVIQGANVVVTRQYKDVLTALQVTPVVLSDDRVKLEYSIQVASVKPEGPQQAPLITTKTTSVKETILRHGESLIVAGILYRKRMHVVRAVPILGEIPLLDLIFSTKDTEDRWFEIVFALTPYIVSTEGASPLAIPTAAAYPELSPAGD
jgi:type II secretory pathway component GspD/PulD (secretin)